MLAAGGRSLENLARSQRSAPQPVKGRVSKARAPSAGGLGGAPWPPQAHVRLGPLEAVEPRDSLGDTRPGSPNESPIYIMQKPHPGCVERESQIPQVQGHLSGNPARTFFPRPRLKKLQD